VPDATPGGSEGPLFNHVCRSAPVILLMLATRRSAPPNPTPALDEKRPLKQGRLGTWEMLGSPRNGGMIHGSWPVLRIPANLNAISEGV